MGPSSLTLSEVSFYCGYSFHSIYVGCCWQSGCFSQSLCGEVRLCTYTTPSATLQNLIYHTKAIIYSLPGSVWVHRPQALVRWRNVLVHCCALAVTILTRWSYANSLRWAPPIHLGALRVIGVSKSERATKKVINRDIVTLVEGGMHNIWSIQP